MRTFVRRLGWAPGGAEVGVGASLPVGLADVRCAAYPGHLEILRWAREHGCEWDEQTCGEPPRADIWRC